MRRSWTPYVIVFALFILIAGMTLAIVLPLTLGHHSPKYCSDHAGWIVGQPLSKCRPPFTYVVPINSVPSNYRLVNGGSTPTAKPTQTRNSSSGRVSTTTSAGRGGTSGSTSGGRGRRMIEVEKL